MLHKTGTTLLAAVKGAHAAALGKKIPRLQGLCAVIALTCCLQGNLQAQRVAPSVPAPTAPYGIGNETGFGYSLWYATKEDFINGLTIGNTTRGVTGDAGLRFEFYEDGNWSQRGRVGTASVAGQAYHWGGYVSNGQGGDSRRILLDYGTGGRLTVAGWVGRQGDGPGPFDTAFWRSLVANQGYTGQPARTATRTQTGLTTFVWEGGAWNVGQYNMGDADNPRDPDLNPNNPALDHRNAQISNRTWDWHPGTAAADRIGGNQGNYTYGFWRETVTFMAITPRAEHAAQGGRPFETYRVGQNSTLTFHNYHAGANTDGGVIYKSSGDFILEGTITSEGVVGPIVDVRGTIYFGDNSAASGGAIFNAQGGLTISRAVFVDSVADENGGAILNGLGGTLTLNSVLFDNAVTTPAWVSSTTIGGTTIPAIDPNTGLPMYVEDPLGSGNWVPVMEPNPANTTYSYGTVTTAGIAFTGNNTAVRGGAIHNRGTILPSGATFRNNIATFDGGAVYNDKDGTITLTGGWNSITGQYNNPFLLNRAGVSGGAIYNSHGGTVNLTNIILTGNYISAAGGGFGGAIYNADAGAGSVAGTINLSHIVFENNSAAHDGTDAVQEGLGGAIYNLGQIRTLNNTSFLNNWARSGGAIYNLGTLPTVDGHTTFSGNKASEYGGAVYTIEAAVTFDNTDFQSNTAGIDGGGLFNTRGDITLENTRFTSNIAVRDGGGVFNAWGTLSLHDAGFVSNEAAFGGGIYNQSLLGAAMVVGDGGVSFSDNKAIQTGTVGGFGGGIFNESGVINITGFTFARNSADVEGGAIYNAKDGQVTLNSGTLSLNISQRGGAIFNSHYASTTLVDAKFEANRSTTAGGGAVFSDQYASLTLRGGVFTNNTAATHGGAIYSSLEGTLNLTDGDFTDNTATTGRGGAIYNESYVDALITGGSFTTNTAQAGGAIYNAANTLNRNFSIVIDGTEFTGNRATAGDGGAIHNEQGVRMTLRDVALTSNRATGNDGGALYSTGGGTVRDGRKITLDIIGGVFDRNQAQHGGALYRGVLVPDTDEEVVITGVTFTRNEATTGGAIYNEAGGILTLNNVHFRNNVASGDGGAIYTDGGTININVYDNTNSIFDVTDSIFFAQTGEEHILNVDIEAGSSLTMRAGTTMEQHENTALPPGTVVPTIEVTKTGDGTWFLRGDVDFAAYDLSGDATSAANFAVLGGTLDLAYNVEIDLGVVSGQGQPPFPKHPEAGVFRLDNAVLNMATRSGITASLIETNGGTVIAADLTTLNDLLQTDLGFDLTGASDGDGPYLTLTLGTPLEEGEEIEIAGKFLVIADGLLNDGDSILLVNTNNGALESQRAYANQLWLFDAINEEYVQQGPFVRSADPLHPSFGLFYGLLLAANDTELWLTMVSSDANSENLTWTGFDSNSWAHHDTAGPANWTGTVAGHPVDFFLNGDTVYFADTYKDASGNDLPADKRNIDVSNIGVRVKSMYVTGPNYEFTLGNAASPATGITAVEDIEFGSAVIKARAYTAITAGGNIDFDTATLEATDNTVVTASGNVAFRATSKLASGIGTRINADTMTFAGGSTLEFNLDNVLNNSTMLRLNGDSVELLSDINVMVTAGSITGHLNTVLVDATGVTNAGLRPGMLFVNGDPTSPVRSQAGGTMHGLAVIDKQITLKSAAADGNSDNLEWRGTSSGIWRDNDPDIRNWSGTVNDIVVNTFLNGDTVIFNDSATGTRTVVIDPAGVKVQSMSVFVSNADTGSYYEFDMASVAAGGTAIESTTFINFGNAHLKNLTGSKIIAGTDINFGAARLSQMTNALIQAVGNINFGTGAHLSEVTGATIDSGGNITFANGSRIDLDVAGANGIAPILTLDAAGSVALNSDLYLNQALDTLLATQNTFVLIDVRRAGASIGVSALYQLVGGNYEKYEADRANAWVYDLDVNANHHLVLTKTAGGYNIDVAWTGKDGGLWTTVRTSGANWIGKGGTLELYDYYFINGDNVVFAATYTDETGAIQDVETKNVTVAGTGVRVGTMSVTDSNYIFNLNIGASSPVITAAGDIDLGNATLNITGYTFGNSNTAPGSNLQKVIESGGVLSSFNRQKVTIAGEASVDYLFAEATQTGNSIWIETELSWLLKDPGKAHGTFTVDSGAFTLDAVLADRTDLSGSSWDGNSLTKKGAGTLILARNNIYTGLTTVEGGSLHLGNGGTEGSVDGPIIVEGGANVTFNRSDNFTFSRMISGEGSLTKQGSGTLTLTTDNYYTGLTTVAAGTLLVNGSLRSDVAVNSGAVFGGHGSVAGLVTVKSGATFSPGSSIGEFTITGGGIVFERDSTYVYEIDKNGGRTDLLIVAADSTVTIQQGALLDVRFLSGIGARGDEFRVIQANESQFSDGTLFDLKDAALFTMVDTWGTKFGQEIRADGYYVLWGIGVPGFEGALRGIGTPNAVKAAGGVDEIAEKAFEAGLIEDLYNNELYSALANMDARDPVALAHAFAQLHGEVFASNKDAAAHMQRQFQQLLPTGREFVSISDLPKVWNRWGTLTGSLQNRGEIGPYSGYEMTSTGVAFGVDRTITPKVLIGTAFGYDNMYQKFDSLRGQSQIDSFRAMIYGSWYDGGFFLSSYGGYAKNLYDTKRNIQIGDYAATARSDYDDDLFSVGLEFGRTLPIDQYVVTPSIGVHYIHIGTPSITENGGGDANLFVASNNYDSLRLPIGAKASRIFTGGRGVKWIPEVRAFYVREFLDDSATVRTSFDKIRDVSFEADSGKWGRSSGRLGMGVSALLTNRFTFRLDYDHEIYNHTTADMFTATLNMSW